MAGEPRKLPANKRQIAGGGPMRCLRALTGLSLWRVRLPVRLLHVPPARQARTINWPMLLAVSPRADSITGTNSPD